jgi:probable HAF family extracellular repeat protein
MPQQRVVFALLSAAVFVACESEHPGKVLAAVGPRAYEWTPLGFLGVGANSLAKAVNNRGQVVGNSDTGNELNPRQRAFLWEDGVMHDLGTLDGGLVSLALGINDRGQVVGTSYAASASRAFLWDNGVMQDLGALAGGSSAAIAINDRGQVIGSSDGSSFLWEDGVMRPLPITAAAINNRGQVAGWVTAASKRSAAVWDAGAVTDLGTLGGDESWARAISENGVVVGASRAASGELHAVLWKGNGIVDLGIPPGSVSAEAFLVNDQGQVAGNGINASGSPRAFLWERGVIQDIWGEGAQQSGVMDLSPNGTLVGWNTGPRMQRGFVWRNGVLQDLGTGGGSWGAPAAINDQSVIVGTTESRPSSNFNSATMWTPSSGSP